MVKEDGWIDTSAEKRAEAKRNFLQESSLYRYHYGVEPPALFRVLLELSYDYFGQNYYHVNNRSTVSFGSNVSLHGIFSIAPSDKNALLKEISHNWQITYETELQARNHFISGQVHFDDALAAILSFDAHLRNPEQTKTFEDMLPIFKTLWRAFPLTDARKEIAYNAFVRCGYNPFIPNPPKNTELDFDRDFLVWASNPVHARNIALYIIFDFALRNRLAEKPEVSLLQRNFRSMLPGGKISAPRDKMDLMDLVKNIHANLNPVVPKNEHHHLTFIKDPVRFLYEECGLRDAYPECSLARMRSYHNSVNPDSPVPHRLLLAYDLLQSGEFFACAYADKYREEKQKQMTIHQIANTAPPRHPIFDLESNDPKCLAYALLYQMAHDDYTSSVLPEHLQYSEEFHLRKHRLNEKQNAALKDLSKNGDESYNLILHVFNDNITGDQGTMRCSAGLAHPKAVALYRIFTAPVDCSLIQRLWFVGLPCALNSQKGLSALNDLVEWLDGKTKLPKNSAISHADAVANLYLHAELAPYLSGFNYDERQRIIERLLSSSKEERENIRTFPEVLFVVTFHKLYFEEPPRHFHDLSQFPFKRFDEEISDYRFGPKQIQSRDAFIGIINNTLFDNYHYIKSGKWARDLKQEIKKMRWDSHLQGLTNTKSAHPQSHQKLKDPSP